MQRLPNTYGAAMPQMTEQARQRSAGDWSGEISRMPMEPIRQTPAGQGGMSGPMGAAGPVGMAGSRTVPPELEDMGNGLPVEVITAPTSTREAYMGSWKALLSRYEGSYVVATFLVGTRIPSPGRAFSSTWAMTISPFTRRAGTAISSATTTP